MVCHGFPQTNVSVCVCVCVVIRVCYAWQEHHSTQLHGNLWGYKLMSSLVETVFPEPRLVFRGPENEVRAFKAFRVALSFYCSIYYLVSKSFEPVMVHTTQHGLTISIHFSTRLCPQIVCLVFTNFLQFSCQTSLSLSLKCNYDKSRCRICFPQLVVDENQIFPLKIKKVFLTSL